MKEFAHLLICYFLFLILVFPLDMPRTCRFFIVPGHYGMCGQILLVHFLFRTTWINRRRSTERKGKRQVNHQRDRLVESKMRVFKIKGVNAVISFFGGNVYILIHRCEVCKFGCLRKMENTLVFLAVSNFVPHIPFVNSRTENCFTTKKCFFNSICSPLFPCPLHFSSLSFSFFSHDLHVLVPDSFVPNSLLRAVGPPSKPSFSHSETNPNCVDVTISQFHFLLFFISTISSFLHFSFSSFPCLSLSVLRPRCARSRFFFMPSVSRLVSY